MAKIELTDVERLLLSNQYEILGLLKNDAFYTEMASNLRDGHKWIYQQHATEISGNMSDEDAQHVLNILGIYSEMKDSYEQLPDKSGIEPHLLNFPGFDGNNEAEFLRFSEALCKNGNYSQTFGEHARNSHSPTTEMYQRMIQGWIELGSPRFPLSKAQILAILEAQTHPSYRK